MTILSALVSGSLINSRGQSCAWNEGFDGGFPGDWFVEGGTWEVGTPTSGPNGAHTGTGVAATVLAGNYAEGASARLIRDYFVVPGASENPRLSFYQWFSFNDGDYGVVQVRVGTGAWKDVSPRYRSSGGGVWTRASIDLSAYAGSNVQIAFLFVSANAGCCSSIDVSSGWYLDDVCLRTGPITFNNPEGFELGLGDWSAESGTWVVGSLANAHSGTNVAGTVVINSYTEQVGEANGVSSRLISPAFTVPTADQNPRLRFYHTFSFNASDSGRVQIKEGTNNWTTVSAVYTSSGGGVWSSPSIDLKGYAGKQVQIGFLFSASNGGCCSDSDISSGWYIDDVAVVTGPITFNNPEGFELGLGDWSAESGSWVVGSILGAHSGNNVAGTILSGNYTEQVGEANGVSSRLISPAFTVPAADQNPRLRFYHTFSFNASDSGQVQIKEGTNNWTTVSAIYTSSGGGVWSSPSIDLRGYAGKQVQIGFLFSASNGGCCSDSDISWGWYIDDVAVVTGPITFNNPEGFELGLGDWSAEGGSWVVGSISAAHSGNKVAGTILSGNYTEQVGEANGVSSRLISPAFTVPAADQNPRLRFYHTFSFNASDSGRVQIKEGTNNWTTVSAVYTSSGGGVWSSPSIDLRGYAGKQVQIGFLFSASNGGCCSDSDISWGWYIDDVALVTGPITFNNPEGFELGLGDWSAESGTWVVGSILGAHSGSKVAGTILSGNYTEQVGEANGVSSRLISPAFTVPAADQNPRLRFYHTFSFNASDSGRVQIKEGTNNWTTVSAIYTSSGGGVWSSPSIDLRGYAGKQVQIGFLFSASNGGCCSDSDISSGWYIDDVAVVTGPITFNNPEGFELGLGDWSAESGTWVVGSILGAHSGNKVAGTILSGNYTEQVGEANGVSSRLISPAFIVPPTDQNPRLRFWHRFCLGSSDSGEVQIRSADGNWHTISTTVTGSSSVWTPQSIPLDTYGGQTVEIAFNFAASSPGVCTGWYIDDVCIVRGALSLTSIANQTVDEETEVRFRVAASGTNGASVLHFDLGQKPPAGATIDASTGDFTWTPSEAQGPATYTIPINCVDSGNRDQNSCIFALVKVNEVNKAPLLSEQNRTIGSGQQATWNLCGADVDIPANTLIYGKLSGPTNFTVNTAGQVTWFSGQPGTYAVTVKVTDNNPPAVNAIQLSATNTFTVTVVSTNSLYIYSLLMRPVSSGRFDFTIINGRIGSNYVLQCAPMLLNCPPPDYWQDLMTTTVTSTPFTFGYTDQFFGPATNRFYRLRTQ